MAQIEEKTIQAKYVTHENEFYIIWWNPALKLMSKGIQPVRAGTKIFPGQAESITIHAATTEQECQDKIDELGLT